MSDFATVRVKMTFPIENRPIYVTPIASMTSKSKLTAYPLMAEALLGLMRLHPEERILVHTVSYELTQKLLRALIVSSGPMKSRLVTYDQGKDRDRTVDLYRSRKASVLLAPSLDRGVDLEGDDCRVIAVCKIPFPYLGDKQVNARLHTKGGQDWFSVQTVRSLVQMTGRGVRNKDDQCASYILDSQFQNNIWAKCRHLLPSWWTEAVDWSGEYVRTLQKLAKQ